MSMAPIIDTLAGVHRLRQGGFEEPQAEAIVAFVKDALEASVATRHDLEQTETALRSDIERVETELRSEIGRVETSLRSNIERVETELSLKIDVGMNQVKSELVRWMMTALFAQGTIIVAAIKLLS